MSQRLPKGYPSGGRMKLSVAFEGEVFQRLLLDIDDRGASFSDHLNWLLKRHWRLEADLKRRQDEEAKREREAKERSRRYVANKVGVHG